MSEETRRPEGQEEKPFWEGKHYAFFCNRECEFFPCHQGVDPEQFNCLFCYCPLYALGEKCGGNFSYNERGIKDCSACRLPHVPKSYGYIIGKYGELMALAARKPAPAEEKAQPETAEKE